MRASEIRRLIQLKPVELNAARRRLSACHDIHELRKSARRVIPRPVFDYVDGAADEELSMAANVRAFRRWRFQPRALTGITTVDTATRLLDRDLPLPLVMAPTGYTRMMHPAGESAVARAAQRHGLPYTLSTMSTTSIEDVAAAAQPDLWFQLYIQKDEGLAKELVNRADAAGYRVLVVTVDTFVTGHRTRDERNGLTIPPALTVQTLGNIAVKPAYWMRMLRSEAIDFANFTAHGHDHDRGHRLDVQPHRQLGRHRRAAGTLAGQAGHQGPGVGRRRDPGGGAGRRRPAAVQPRRAPAGPDRPAPST